MKILGTRDMILAAAILLIAAAVFGFNYVSHRTPAATAQISVDGKVVEILDLSKDTELTVTSPGGGTNHLIVKDGEIWCSEASSANSFLMESGSMLTVMKKNSALPSWSPLGHLQRKRSYSRQYSPPGCLV